MKAWIMAVALVMAAPFVALGQSSVSTIETSDAWARLPSDGTNSTTAYVEIFNKADVADQLLGASSDIAERVVIEHLVMEGYDMKAKVVPAVKIGAHRSVKLRPNDYRLRLYGLSQKLKPDQKIPITLRFERGGRVEIEASISNQKLGNLDDR